MGREVDDNNLDRTLQAPNAASSGAFAMAVRVVVLASMAVHAAESLKMHRGAALPAPRSLPIHWPTTPAPAVGRMATTRLAASRSVRMAAATAVEDDSSTQTGEWAKQDSMVVTKGPHVKVAGKTLNPCGLFICILTMSVCACCYPPLLVAYTLSRVFDNKKRRMVDYIVNIWAKMVIRISTSAHTRARAQPHHPLPPSQTPAS